jgi:hypothetical protein
MNTNEEIPANFREGKNIKLQTSSSKPATALAWDLEFGISLELGAWDLEFL